MNLSSLKRDTHINQWNRNTYILSLQLEKEMSIKLFSPRSRGHGTFRSMNLHHYRFHLTNPFHLIVLMLSLVCFRCFNYVSALGQFNDFVFPRFRNNNLSLVGMENINTMVFLELTNATQWMLGHALYPFSLHFNISSNNSIHSFNTTFVMSIVL